MTLAERLRAVRIKRPVPRTIFTVDEDHPLCVEAADEIERLEKALETAREALEPFARIKPVSISLADDHIASSAFHRADEVYRTLSQKKGG